MKKRKKKHRSEISRKKETIETPMAPQHDLPAEDIIETPAAPLHELPTECYDPYLLVDDDDWLLLMDPAFCDNPGLAVTFAHLLLRFKESVESGPEGVERTSFTLIDGIRMAYKYTEEHQLAFRLFILYLEGRLKVQNEPLQLLKAAIASADVEKG